MSAKRHMYLEEGWDLTLCGRHVVDDAPSTALSCKHCVGAQYKELDMDVALSLKSRTSPYRKVCGGTVTEIGEPEY